MDGIRNKSLGFGIFPMPAVEQVIIMQLNTEQKVIGGIVILTIVFLVGGVFLFSGQQSQEVSVPEDQIVSRVGLHWHPKLEVFIHGKKQEFTDSIGLGAVHQPMHTHAQDYKDGVVHMEIQGVVTKDETRLERFFEIWGKEFSSTQIFEFKNSTEAALKMLVNGKENSDFENYKMQDGDKIEIRYE